MVQAKPAAVSERGGDRKPLRSPSSTEKCGSIWRQICIGSQTGTLGYANAAQAECDLKPEHQGRHTNARRDRSWTDQDVKTYLLCKAKVERLVAAGHRPVPPAGMKGFRAYEQFVLGLPEKGPVRGEHSVGPVATVHTPERLREVVAIYMDMEEFAFDVETHANRPMRGKKDKPALDTRTNEVWCLSLAGKPSDGPRVHHVIPVGHPDKRHHQLNRDYVFEALYPLFFSNRRKINQNVGFDLLSIAKYYGEIPPPPYADIMTMIFLINENLTSYKLAALAQHYLGFTYIEKLGEAAYSAPWRDAMNYSLTDARVAWNLWAKMSPVLEQKPKLGALFDLEMEVLRVLLAMKQQGAYVDVEGFHTLKPKLEAQLTDMRDHIRAMVPECWCEPRRRWQGQAINLNSTQQLAHWLYDHRGLRCPLLTGSGKESTSAPALKALAQRREEPRLVLAYKDVQKLLSTYVNGFIPTIDEDSRIRASFNQAVARTGRLSCSQPNLQNIPARYKETVEATLIRGLFVAPPGRVLIVADYSQIELRILAHQTRDRLLLYAYKHGLDLHTQTASLIYKVPQDKVSVEQRAIAKNCNFNFAFEGRAGRVVDLSGISLREAEKVYTNWHKAYPGVQKWGAVTKRFCLAHGYVETLYGRKRRLKDIASGNPKDRSYAERQAVNHPIQGSAADIAKVAIVRVHEALREFHAALVLQIHDEFVIECDQAEAQDAIPFIRTAMEDIRLGGRPVLDVPLEVNIGVGMNWNEAK